MNCSSCPIFEECKLEKIWLSREVAEPKKDKKKCPLLKVLRPPKPFLIK